MLLRSTFIYGPAILLTRVSALLLLIVVTRLVDQQQYGLLTLVVTVGEMTDLAVSNWLRIALLRLGGRGDVSRGSLVLAGRVLVVSTAGALCIAVAASAIVVPDHWQAFALAVCAYLVAGSIARFALTVLQMQQRHATYSLLECLRALLQLVLPIGAILVFPPSFLTISLGTSAGMLAAGLIAGAFAARCVVPGPPRFAGRELFALGAPLVAMAVLGFGLNSAERLFLNAYHDAAAVAVFAAAYLLARQPIDMVGNAINTGAFPEAMSRFDEQGSAASSAFLSELMALLMRLCLPVAAMLIALGGPLAEILLPEDYHGRVAPLFPLIAFSVLCANLTSFVYGVVIHAHKRPALLIVATLLGSVGTIGLSVLLIPRLAELGAALALAGGSVMSLAACATISTRLTSVRVPWRDLGVSLVVAAGTGLAAGLASYLAREELALVRLIAGGGTGAAVFLAMIWLFHPEAARRFILSVAQRYRGAPPQ